MTEVWSALQKDFGIALIVTTIIGGLMVVCALGIRSLERLWRINEDD